jgi:cytochrome c peroxidase
MTRTGWTFALGGPLLAVTAAAAVATHEGSAPVPESLPLGISATIYELSVPASAAPTPEKAALGEKLFNDKRLSIDDTVSCATCHVPDRGFVDHLPTSEGVGKQRGKRNSPTVLNAMFLETQFWDGRAPTLQAQAKLPILNPIEMGMKSPEDVVAKVRAMPEYAEAFREVYGRAVTYDNLADAIAAFEREQVSGNSPFDRYIAGDSGALSASAKRGWVLFNSKARCNSCHAFSTTSPIFADQKFHNIGIAAHKTDFPSLARKADGIVRAGDLDQIDRLALETDLSELGRFLVTKQRADIGAFKTPTLRNIAVTAPYMHDGSLATLWDVMDHYNKGGVPNPFLDGGMQILGLSEAEIDDVVAFLAALTGDRFSEFGKQEVAAQEAKKSVRPERDTEVAMGKKGNMGDVGPDPDLTNPVQVGVLPPVPQL